jgi:PrgI family protein
MTTNSDAGRGGGEGRVRVPADLDRPDPLLAGLAARQLTLLAGFGLAAWILAGLAEPLLGLPLAAILAAPMALAGLGLALGWRDGIALDRLALAAIGWGWQPRRRVVAPHGLPAAPGWEDPSGPRLAPLTGPVSGLDSSGVLELAGSGHGLVGVASPVNLRLRTPAEQQQLLAGFARLLHALDGPMQVLVRSQPADLAPLARRLRTRAAGLAHPALEQAALAHASWLEDLRARHEARHRELLVIFTQPPGVPHAAAALARQAEQATTLLAGVGVTLTVLDAGAAGRVLAAATNPTSPARPAGLAPAGTVITGRQP